MKQTEQTMDKTYRINEIFYSLQGEGYHTGTPAVFLRMSGCNRKCPFCDTDHSGHTAMTADEIISAVTSYPSRHIIVTGGEPLMQLDSFLIEALHDAGFYIQIETNGTLPIPEGIDWVACSSKDGQLSINRIDEMKIVYLGQDVESVATSLPPATHYFLQPCTDPKDGSSNTAQTIAYILSHPHWRLSLQTHKLTGIR